jgi:hypothetical protein
MPDASKHDAELAAFEAALLRSVDQALRGEHAAIHEPEQTQRAQVVTGIRLIGTEQDYKAALKAVSALVELDPKKGTPEGDQLDLPTTLVQAYEAKQAPSISVQVPGISVA